MQACLTSDNVGIMKFTPFGDPLLRPEEVNPEKLSLALEPEAAAIYSHHYSTVVGPPPEKYMVIDIGGGTVDITVHDRVSGKICVVLPPMGDTWGGTKVNEALSFLLEELVQDKAFDSFLQCDELSAKAALNKLFYVEFEEEKKKFGDKYKSSNLSLEEMSIVLPPLFVKFYTPAKLEKRAQKLGMAFEKGEDTLYIPYRLVEKRLFMPTTDDIIQCGRRALDQLIREIETVYLVGGFGGSHFLRQKIEEAIYKYYDLFYDSIACPQQPELAVVIGAVMWRKDPDIIQSRVADATYGINVAPVFDPLIHDKHYRFLDEEGQPRCDYVFKVFVLKGEVIKDEVYKSTLIPAHQKDTQVCIPIYSTADNGVCYIKDKEGKLTVRKIGDLVLNIPNPGNIPRDERKFDIFMDFSGTEIQAKAQYSVTKEEVETVCDFLSNQD